MTAHRYRCIDCSRWSMWDGRCGCREGWPEMDADTPACARFRLDLGEVELQLGRALSCADCTQCAGASCMAGCDTLQTAAQGSAGKCPRFLFRECRPKYLN